MKWLRLTGLAMGVAVLAGLLAVGVRSCLFALSDDYWRQRIDATDDAHVDALIERLAERYEAAPLLLVEALNARRDCVAAAARRALHQQLGRWQLSPDEAADDRLTMLADALAKAAPAMQASARRDAAELTARLLQSPMADSPRRQAVIRRCEQVLQTLGEMRLADDPPAAESAELASTEANPSPPMDFQPLNAATPSAAKSPSAQQANIIDQGAVDASRAKSMATAPQPRPLLSLENPLRHAVEEADPIAVIERPRQSMAATAQPPAVQPASALLPADEKRNRAAAAVERAEPLDLIRQTFAADPQAASKARRELIRRGFQEVHFRLAQALIDPDPAVRQQLARTVTGLAGIDGAAWLMWLSEDSDPEVRHTAITLMATTGNPALLEQAQQRAGRDADLRIRRLAEQLASPGGRRTARP